MNLTLFWKSLTLLIFAMALVIFGYLKSVDAANQRFVLHWNQSHWITTIDPAPSGYFRSNIELDDVVKSAVLQIAATDRYVVYLNGEKLDSKQLKSTNAAGVYDIGHLLNIGKNILAVMVNRSTFPAEVELRYEIKAIDTRGKSYIFQSGFQDKVRHLLPQQRNELLWYSPEIDDSDWPNSKYIAGSYDVSKVNFDPNFILTLPEPNSLLISSTQSWKVAAQYNLVFNSDENSQVWFGVASEVPYELIINGISLGIFSINQTQLNLQSIQTRLVDGDNSIEVEFLTSGKTAQIAGGLFIDSPKLTKTIFLSDNWNFVGKAGGSQSLLDEIQALSAYQNVTLANSSDIPNYSYFIDDSFVAPQLIQAGPWSIVFILVTFGLILFVFFKVAGLSIEEQLNATVLANVIGCLCILGSWFVAQDIRFDARKIFSLDSFNLLLILWILLVLVSLGDKLLVSRRYMTHIRVQNSAQALSLNDYLFWLVALVVVVVAFVLRLDDIDLRALTVDEATIAGFARGVLERGYPYLMVGGMEVELATYELVPYFLALSIKVFGYSDFALRVPAMIFGVLTCTAVIYCGAKWFGRLAGLIAGLLYALSPWAIYWGQNCFHPAQIQFFSLLSLIVFYRLLMADKLSIGLAVLSALMFAFSYLSWEGSGLVLPIMAIVALVIRWRNWQWFMQVNLWTAALLILFVIVAQGVRRVLLQEPFVMVGFGKSDLAAPKLTFTDPSYEPWYYLQNFFFTESHIGLSLFFIIGFILMFYDRKLSFVVLFVVMAYLSLTNLLGFYNAHYFYFVLPVFLLAVSAVFIKLLMLIQRLIAVQGSTIMQVQGAVAAALLAFVLIIPSSSGVLHLYRLMAESVDGMRVDYRPGLAGMDGREISLSLAKYWREGDIVMSSIPLISEHYAQQKGDYFVQTITDRKVVYDTVKKSPYYVDKFVGNPVLRSKQELQDVLENNSRVFFIAAPVDGLTRIIDDETLSYINQHMRVIAESYDSRLYLWER